NVSSTSQTYTLSLHDALPIFVIPARFKSTRLPGKPLLAIHGKPMILWVAEKAKLADFADDMCIATDDEAIAKVCIEAGFDVVMRSEEHTSELQSRENLVCRLL